MTTYIVVFCVGLLIGSAYATLICGVIQPLIIKKLVKKGEEKHE